MMKKYRPAELELRILNALWDRGPSTVRDLLPALSSDKPRAYTTVLSTMQVMEKKKLLKREGTQSGAIIYAPAIVREQVTKPALRDLIANMFGGKPSAVMQHLLDDSHVDETELAEIRRLLDAHAKSAARKSSKGESRKGTTRK